MALPATYLRFAIDMAERHKIKSARRYLCGTLYPDSRWLFGANRNLSRSAPCSRPDFAVDDFTLGWHVHCRCDLIQNALFLIYLPALVHLDADQRWRELSVAKMLQDREDMGAIDMDAALEAFSHIRAPFNEDP